MSSTRITCDHCGQVVALVGLASHQRGRPCEVGSFVRKMETRGWERVPRDLRAEGVPCEHGPSKAVSGGIGRRGYTSYAYWAPAWANDLLAALKASSTQTRARQADIWKRALADAAWREAVGSAYALGGFDAAARMLEEVVNEPRENNRRNES